MVPYSRICIWKKSLAFNTVKFNQRTTSPAYDLTNLPYSTHYPRQEDISNKVTN